jgi:hypothetical protein
MPLHLSPIILRHPPQLQYFQASGQNQGALNWLQVGQESEVNVAHQSHHYANDPRCLRQLCIPYTNH